MPQCKEGNFLEYFIYENVKFSPVAVVCLAQQLQPLEELRYIDILYNVGVSGTLFLLLCSGRCYKLNPKLQELVI